VLAGLGHGLDQAAVTAIQKTEFEPAPRCIAGLQKAMKINYAFDSAINRSLAACLVAFALCVVPASASAQQGTAGTGDTSQRAGRLTKAPQLTNFKEVEAPYPEEERASGRTAAVTLQLAISERGDVSEVVVLDSAGAAFDKAAIESAKRFKFTPAEIDGKPAPVKLTFRYDFTSTRRSSTSARR